MKRVVRQKIVDGVLLLLAVLAGVAVVTTQRCQSNDTSSDASGAVIPGLAEAQPHSLVLSRNGRSVRVVSHSSLSNDSLTWHVESPWQRAAELATVDAAVTALRDMQVLRSVPVGPEVSSEDLKRLGLLPPRFSWQVEIDGSVWSLEFGAEAPAPRGGTYVDVTPPGSQAHKFYVASIDVAKLSLQPEQLLEPRLVPYVSSDFGDLTLEAGANRVALHFDNARQRWFDTEGQRYRASRSILEPLLTDITTLKGEHFLTPVEAAAKTWGQKTATVQLVLAKLNSTIRLKFGGVCDGQPTLMFVHVSGLEEFTACADVRTILANLDRSFANHVDAHLFSLRPDEVESVTTQSGGHSLQLERWESSFRLAGPVPRAIDLESGNGWLQTLLAIRGTLVRNRTSTEIPPFDEKQFVQLRSAVVGPSESYQERVYVGPANSSGERFIKRDSDGALLRVSAQEAASLAFDPDHLEAEKVRANLTPDAGQDSSAR